MIAVWIAELGKYDMLKLVNMGPKVLKEFEIYCKYAARLWTDSHSLKNPDGETLSLLLDFDGLRLVQYAQLHSKLKITYSETKAVRLTVQELIEGSALHL